MLTDNSKIANIFKGVSFTNAEIKIIESVFFKETHKKGSKLLKQETMLINNTLF